MRAIRRRFAAAVPGVLAVLLAAGPVRAQDSAAAEDAGGGEDRGSVGVVRDFNVVVDLSERMLYARSGDEVLRSYRVAIGKPQHPTPKGEFTIRRIIWNPRWVPPDARWARGKRPRGPGDPRNPMGRVKMFFQAPDYYVHGTHDEDSLGEAESHGCIRMRNSDVMDLARIVMENGGEAREPGWFQRVINRVRSTSEVRLSQAVAFKVRE